jgi:hypothetical protein
MVSAGNGNSVIGGGDPGDLVVFNAAGLDEPSAIKGPEDLFGLLAAGAHAGQLLSHLAQVGALFHKCGGDGSGLR